MNPMDASGLEAIGVGMLVAYFLVAAVVIGWTLVGLVREQGRDLWRAWQDNNR